jgi:hypothetical protein
LDIGFNESKWFVIFWNERCAGWYVKEPATGWIEFLAPGLGNRHTNQDVTGGIYERTDLLK